MIIVIIIIIITLPKARSKVVKVGVSCKDSHLFDDKRVVYAQAIIIVQRTFSRLRLKADGILPGRMYVRRYAR